MKEHIIFKKWLAAALRDQGYTLIRTAANRHKPEYDVYFFEDVPGFSETMAQLTKEHTEKYGYHR